MTSNSNDVKLPYSPFDIKEGGQNKEGEKSLSRARKIAVSGNMYHKWQTLELSEFDKELAPETPISHPGQKGSSVSVPSQTQEEQLLTSASEDRLSFYQYDDSFIKDFAAVEQVTDQMSASPKIQNRHVNWVDEWDASGGKGSPMHSDTRELKNEGQLYEQVLPDHTLPKLNAIDDMKDSKFLSWLKQKDAQRSDGQKSKTEFQKDKKAKESKGKKQEAKQTSVTSEEKISKKKKKKELKKILKKSLEMEDEIVSETLANIMAQQGHIGKAIDMYEKLSLIFPEKSSYFADIIENLEEE